jgi:hypothetical protein
MSDSPRRDPGPRQHTPPAGRRLLATDPGAAPRTHRRPGPAGHAVVRWGALPARAGVVMVGGAAGLGALLTIAGRLHPGLLLGACVLLGALAAALAVRPGAVYRLIPIPVLAYVAAALVVVPFGGQGTGTSTTALALATVQALASGFLPMIGATALVITCTVLRGRRPRPTGRHPGRGS